MRNFTLISPGNVIRTQYFFYFGVMGIFLPYFNLYCYHIDFSGFQIGVLSAVRSVAMIVFPLLWGVLADRTNARRPIYIVCNAASTAAWGLFLLTTDFSIMLAITVLYGMFYAPIIPLLEAFTMDVLGSAKRRYGRLRAWGSVSFIAVVVVMGRLIDLYAIDIIVVLILGGAFLQTLGALKMPAVTSGDAAVRRTRIDLLFRPQVMIFLVCAFLMLVSHGTYYGFFSIHLENLGYGKTFIGVAWALASIAEILVMLKSEALFKRFALEKLLLFSFGVATFRWLVLSYAQSFPVILVSQVLHAVTYGTFHMSSILYVDRLMPAEAKALGQAANNSLTYGLGLMVGFLFNGYFFAGLGAFTLFGLSALTALTGGLLFAGFSLRQKPAQSQPA